MTGLRLALLLPFATLALGCETPDDDYPRGGETIRIGRAILGRAVEVRVSQQTDEWELCTPQMGEFGPWIDCEETRERAATLTSIACVPADACRDVKLQGARGTFFPIREQLEVRVVANIEGRRVETRRPVRAERPDGSITMAARRVVVGERVEVCRTGEAGITFTVTLNGEPLGADPAPSYADDCTGFVPRSRGELRAVPRLIDPPVDLDPVTASVHTLGEIEQVEIMDARCSRADGIVRAYLEDDGRYRVDVIVSAKIGGERVNVPRSALTLRNGAEVVSDPDGSGFVLAAPPAPDARVELDLDGRTVSAPVRAGSCSR